MPDDPGAAGQLGGAVGQAAHIDGDAEVRLVEIGQKGGQPLLGVEDRRDHRGAIHSLADCIGGKAAAAAPMRERVQPRGAEDAALGRVAEVDGAVPEGDFGEAAQFLRRTFVVDSPRRHRENDVVIRQRFRSPVAVESVRHP